MLRAALHGLKRLTMAQPVYIHSPEMVRSLGLIAERQLTDANQTENDPMPTGGFGRSLASYPLECFEKICRMLAEPNVVRRI
jgi:hypothetical protein